MTRPPFKQDDVKRLNSIASHLFRGVQGFDTKNSDKRLDNLTRALLFNGVHEFQKCVGKGPKLAPGSISRAEIQLYVAVGLAKLTGISIAEAFHRARTSGLERLSCDLLTVERIREDRAMEVARTRGVPLSASEMHRHRHPLPEGHENYSLFVECGAPPFEITVRKDGMAFAWGTMVALYDAIQKSAYKKEIFDPIGWEAGEKEAITSFLRRSIPQLWVPIPQLIKAKLFEVPDHEVVYLFDEEGYHIGRAIRHTKHGSFMPRLLLTEEQVYTALSFVLRGSYLESGSSLTHWLTPPRVFHLPVYALKPGAPRPKPIHDEYQNTHVPVADLERVPGIHGCSWTLSQPARGRSKTTWMIGGRSVYKTLRDFPSSLMPNYYESEPWLRAPDLPGLFPHHLAAGAAVDEASEEEMTSPMRFEQRHFLPDEAVDLQLRAERLLERMSSKAQARVQEAVLSGELLKSLQPDMLERVVTLTDQVLVERVQELGTSAQAHELVGRHQATLTHLFPQLGVFGPYTLWAALVLLNGEPGAAVSDESTVTLQNVLLALASIQCSAVAGHDIEFVQSMARSIAIAEWLDGVIHPAQVQAVAMEFQRYRRLLKVQSVRISEIERSVQEDHGRRSLAADHGFLYVGAEVPRAVLRINRTTVSNQ